MPPPPAGCPGVGGSRSKSDRSAFDRDRSPQPGPSGLGCGSWSRSEYGRSSSAPSGAADDDRSTTFDTVDLDKDDSSGLCFASSGFSIVWWKRQV